MTDETGLSCVVDYRPTPWRSGWLDQHLELRAVGGQAMSSLPLSAFIEADICLLTPEEGGRRTGIASGYRCNCRLWRAGEHKTSYHDATVFILDVPEILPGSSARARLQPHYPDVWADLAVGSDFGLCEGPRVIGRATVTELFPMP
jgi:translation elongation factor EF-Tu-like GTPase